MGTLLMGTPQKVYMIDDTAVDDRSMIVKILSQIVAAIGRLGLSKYFVSCILFLVNI